MLETENIMPITEQRKTPAKNSKSSPLISVIVPMHNAERHLVRCMQSLAKQTFRDFEVIFVDDGSTDNTLSVCKEHASLLPSSNIIHQDAQGVSYARNTGVRAAQGRYIGFVDADDWIAPTMFETLYQALVETQSDIAQVAYVHCSGPVKKTQTATTVRTLSAKEALAEMLLKEEYSVSTRLYDRELFKTEDEVFPLGLTCEDRVANFKLISKASQIVVSDSVEYYYFLNLGSISYNGLDRRGFDLLAADALLVKMAQELGDSKVLSLAKDRAAKGSYSLLVKWARFGTTDNSLNEEEALTKLKADFKENYARLMKSQLSKGKKIVAWQLRYTPTLLRVEFMLYNALSGIKKRK